MWSEEEVKAVEHKLMNYIRSGKVPGKDQCKQCIEAFPKALKARTWDAVKYYVKKQNRQLEAAVVSQAIFFFSLLSCKEVWGVFTAMFVETLHH